MMIRKKIKEWRVKLDKKSISTEMLIKQIQFAEMPQLSTIWKRRFTNGTDIIEIICSIYEDNEFFYGKGSIIFNGNSIYTPEERIEDKHHTMWFEKIALKLEIEKLDEKERLILYMRYQLDFNQEKVAQRLNISQVQVSRLEKKIITKLRKHLNESH